jgi:Fe2+ or Zn2+ uptake regulation protein
MQRYSKKREQILATLKASGDTMSAQAIHAALSDVDLTTIYRNLDQFVADGVVKRVLLTDKEALYEYQEHPHHHAVCIACERVIHFTAPDKEIKELLGIKDFAIDEIEVTVRGVCRHK